MKKQKKTHYQKIDGNESLTIVDDEEEPEEEILKELSLPKTYIFCPKCFSTELARCPCQHTWNFQCQRCKWEHNNHHHRKAYDDIGIGQQDILNKVIRK